MVKHSKEEREVATPSRYSKRTKGNQAASRRRPSLNTKESDGPEELALACKPLRVGILKDDKGVARLRANLRKMDCAQLLDVPWYHEEPAWLQEIWRKDRSAFPNTVRANPELWKENMIAEVFGICREGLGLPYKVKGHNYAKNYFTSKAHTKEGWKFSECKDEALRDVFKFLTPLVNPLKPARITGKFATTVVECLFFDKKVSWAKVLEEVRAQQVKLMEPKKFEGVPVG
jgi:hypothetical protein